MALPAFRAFTAHSGIKRAGAWLLGTFMLATAALSGTARAADTIIVGTVGAVAANLWPLYIGMNEGFFDAESIKVALVFAQSSAQTLQQLAANSINAAISVGLVDPIRAIDKGAAVGIIRIDTQFSPYVVVAKPAIKSLKELKGKTISVGGPKDITRTFLERMLTPSGVKPDEYDLVYAGATTARFSALQSGAVDAAIVLPPFNFRAESAGFVSLGNVMDFARDLPFGGTVVNTAWAKEHVPLVQRFLKAYNSSVDWFGDAQHHAAAVDLMVKVSGASRDDTEKTYDFFRKGNLIEPTGKVSRAKLKVVVDALQSLGDLEHPIDPQKLIVPGVTELTDGS